jgi:hypothetical protein
MDPSPVGRLEVQQHEDVEQFGAGSGTERVQGARVAGARAHRDARSEATPSNRRLSACRGQRLVNENGRESADSLSCTYCSAAYAVCSLTWANTYLRRPVCRSASDPMPPTVNP